MYKKYTKIKKAFLWTMAFLPGLIAVSCVSVIDETIFPGTNDSGSVFVSVTISNSHISTKATPSGGEYGDGEETGFGYENKISDLTVFFYQSGSGIDALSDTPIIASLYFTNITEASGFVVTDVLAVKGLETGTTYHVAVAANAGDLTSLTSLGDVRDYLVKQAWKTGTTNSDFVMSSEADATITIQEINNTPLVPANVAVAVERIAARIDFLPKSADASAGTVANQYAVKSGGVTVAKVTIDKIKILNKLTAGSFLFKRTANATGASFGSVITYLGNETKDISGIQTNYVIDPWSFEKTIAHLSGGYFNKSNGGAGSDLATSLYANYSPDVLFTMNDAKPVKPSLAGEDFYVLDYTLENTTEKASQVTGYTTGVMFEASYIPLKITSFNSSALTNEISDNSNVITFYSYNGESGNVLYNSLEALEYTSLKSPQPVSGNFFTKTFSTLNTWQDVADYSTRLKTNDILGYRLYLETKYSGKQLSATLSADEAASVSWQTFKTGFDTNTRLKLRALNVGYFEHGTCYYSYWIRHSNNNSSDSGIMEFGIVRNNVYKLKVNSISSLGKPAAINENPDTPDENGNINVDVFVRSWNLIAHPEIIL